MADSPSTQLDAAPAKPPVVVKKYANRRLYNTETSSYITLDNLADMVRAGRDFIVYDAKSSEDITRGVLTQIIVEEESKGASMLPTNFLRQLIGFYGDSLQGVVPRYLEQAMSNFAVQQKQMRQVMQQTFTPFLPVGVEEMGRQNIAMIERAMAMFNPFHRPGDAMPPGPGMQASAHGASSSGASSSGASPSAEGGDVAALTHELEHLRAQLAIARAEAAMAHAASVPPKPVQATQGAAAPVKASHETPTAALTATRKVRTARKPH
jgi:polyhydroxyalkanoate synthesis repressor PhaR